VALLAGGELCCCSASPGCAGPCGWSDLRHRVHGRGGLGCADVDRRARRAAAPGSRCSATDAGAPPRAAGCLSGLRDPAARHPLVCVEDARRPELRDRFIGTLSSRSARRWWRPARPSRRRACSPVHRDARRGICPMFWVPPGLTADRRSDAAPVVPSPLRPSRRLSRRCRTRQADWG
jgi:hypothetical protein